MLEAVQDPRAAAILQRGHDLLQRAAGSITDAELRTSFLQEVQPHQALQERYAAMSAPT